MIQLLTQLEIADNSGAKKASMIGVIGRHGKMNAEIGDIITASIKEAMPRGNVKKGEVVKAVIVRTKSPIRRKDGSSVKFSSNAVVILITTKIRAGPAFLGRLPVSYAKEHL